MGLNLLCRIALASVVLVWASAPMRGSSATIFEDGFESGTLGPQWTVETSNDGRVTVSTSFSPATGQWHLVLDDSIADVLYSSAAATLRLDLSDKKNVTLSFKSKSLGNEPDFDSLDQFDGLSISLDGGLTWRAVNESYNIARVGTEWETFTILLDYYGEWDGFGYTFPHDVRIRFSEYDNAPVPLDGVAIDDVVIMGEEDQRVVIEMADQLVEGSGPHTGYLLLAHPSTNAITVGLSATPGDQLMLPQSVNIPAGQTVASFTSSVPDDNLVNLTRRVVVEASAPGTRSKPRVVTILDDDAPTVFLAMPAQIREGESSNAIVTLSRPADVPVELGFWSLPYGEIDFSSVTIPPGRTNAVVQFNALDDLRVDGNVTVEVSLVAEGLKTATAQITTIDIDVSGLSMQVPDKLLEGFSSSAASIVLASSLETNLPVFLTVTSGSGIVVPSVVTVFAGSMFQQFTIQSPNNLLLDGTRIATIRASAAGLPSAEATVTVRDDDVAAYQFSGITDIVDQGRPLPIAISALDVEAHSIDGFTGPLMLELVVPDGSTLPVEPNVIQIAPNGGWPVQLAITLPRVTASPVRLRATDAEGRSTDSAPFDFLRVVNVPAADLVWDSHRGRFYATVGSAIQDTNANRLMVIDPASALVTTNILLGQDPGKMALTSGGEYLYIVQNENGNISRIDPNTMTVESSFSLGTDPAVGSLFAGDIVTVAGQPDLLVVAQNRNQFGPSVNRVALYDRGVARATRTPDRPGLTALAPSTDPSVMYAFNYQGGVPGLRRLQLGPDGIVEIGVLTGLDLGFSGIRSEGDRIFGQNGVVASGSPLSQLGAFQTYGAVCPAPDIGIVYFVEYRYVPSLQFSGYLVGTYDSTTFSSLRYFKLPDLPIPTLSAQSLIRWGTNGIAFRASSGVVLISSRQIVPSDPAANLALTSRADLDPAVVGLPLTYSLTISNQGPGVAKRPVLTTTLSAGQTVQSAAASHGTVTTDGAATFVLIPDLDPGAVETVVIKTLPQSAGPLSCVGVVTAQAVDPDLGNNVVSNIVSAVFQSSPSSVNHLRLKANNLIYDPTRNRLWATIPVNWPSPSTGSVVSIDPLTGATSVPIMLGGNPSLGCTTLSLNGRYLYSGLSDAYEIVRVDLESGNAIDRIPLAQNLWGQSVIATDIQPLDGNGRSFIVTSAGDGSVSVFDDAVRRSGRAPIGTASRIQPTPDPDVFLTYFYPKVGLLSVGPSGVSVIQSVNYLFSNANEVTTSGNLVLADTGELADIRGLILRANFRRSGPQCLDALNRRAYFANYNSISAYDTLTGLLVESIPLGAGPFEQPSQCLRWGFDGLAVLAGDVYIVRSPIVLVAPDSNSDGLPDSWEADNFETLNINLAADPDRDGLSNFEEYLFATSPFQADANPVQTSTTTSGGEFAIRLVFPRRTGLVPQPYGFSISTDLGHWSPAQNVSETVLSTQTVNGISIETVETIIPFPGSATGFLRFEWKPQ